MATYSGTPRTWSSGETVTAALMNSDVRDPLAALAGVWDSYTPTLTGFTLGNGTISGQYMQVGKLVIFRAVVTFGTTSAAASAVPELSLPVTARGTHSGQPLSGNGQYRDDSTVQVYAAWPRVTATTRVGLYIIGTNGLTGTPSTTTPFTWATSDSISVAGVYEAA